VPLIIALVLAVARPAAADGAAPLRATMSCDPAADVGRVRCEVEARAAPGSTIAWGDVVILRVPPIATALRGRVGPHDASVREPSLWRWTFALVARLRGSGGLGVKVRVVVCEEEVCGPREVEVAAQLQVGEPKAP
jgi:hypothetical protein